MIIFETTHKKYIEISPNMPGIGSVIHELAVKISENLRKQIQFCSVKPMPRSKR